MKGKYAPSLLVWWDNIKKVSWFSFGRFFNFFGKLRKITIKAKTLNFKSDHHERKIYLLIK
ncbi:hypothetical protein [Mesomycoplasma ovipneumoniae]|uniref:hypothetical protein n=1 Tax=Mesomycoplasma ovipneumoniae TaxID=29562 RepID=UPI0028AE2909|nr:hypothetical protein [Mesomycoplasma ovipneumoniae]MDW2933209.1 hypothetical protein [Mesomycoplasma ovipneumoniae]WNM15575.1 hypothetical protein RNM12_02485 [Mesomycoplasma ovipneumoniae]